MTFSHRAQCNLNNLSGIRAFIRSSLSTLSIPEDLISDMVLALDEMCSNLIIHTHQCDDHQWFDLYVYIVPNQKVVFEIIDSRQVFDINLFSEPSLDNLIHEKRKGGLGIRIIKSIMDMVEYEKRGAFYICRLSKKLTPT